jgi:hypothetical protein
MNLLKSASAIISAVSATLVLSAITAGKAQALSEISLPERFVIENAHNRSMVVDKFGDDPNSAAKAHLYSKADTRTHTLRGVRSSNGSYEVKSAFNGNLCFTMSGGLNPNQGNGTLAIFSGDCNNSLNLRFFDDGTVRVARNTNLCLTNQGNRHSTLFNKLHWWACDGSPETKWNIAAANGQSEVYNPPVVSQQYNPPAQVTPAQNSPTPEQVKAEDERKMLQKFKDVNQSASGWLNWPIIGWITQNTIQYWANTHTNLYMFSLTPAEQYKRTDNWFFTGTPAYKNQMNKLACVAKMDAAYRTVGKRFEGPFAASLMSFEQDGSSYNCFMVFSKEKANELKIIRGW